MKKINITLLLITSVMVFLTSCNKELETLPNITVPAYPVGTTLGKTIAANANDSLFNRLLIRSGLSSLFLDSTKTFTMFVPDNAV